MRFSDQVLLAASRIAPHVRVTPAMQIDPRSVGVQTHAEIWLKLEHTQVSGSFKARGIFNRMLSQRIPDSGVMIASGGNAGIAVAYAAHELGVPAEIFVHALTSDAKRMKLEKLGATVHIEGSSYAEALEACILQQQVTGALLLHAYDQPEVLTGAGTLAREIAEQVRPDSVLVSVGGGGLVGGIAAWMKDTKGSSGATKVIALEPELAPTLHAALAANGPVDVAVGGVAADALGAKRLGELAWSARAGITESLLLSDPAIRHAQKLIWEQLQLAVEPAAALPLAALIGGQYKPRSRERVCLLLCGGNVDLNQIVK